MSNNLLTDELSAPLNGATAASIEIDTGTGNLTVDELPQGAQVLASGTLQYFEKQGRPTESFSADRGKATVKLSATSAGRPWFRLPWEACLGGTEWQVHLNPSVPSEITAHTGGGNVKLNLADMALTNLSADTGGGNIDISLPEHAADLRVKARTGGGNISIELGDAITGSNTVEANSGAGNVVVEIPSGIPVRVDASTGLGKVRMEPRFSKIGAHMYQSSDYEDADDKLDITLHSGAGNVSVTTK
jgi:cell wall-active antibiotic response 4TMS protein YvqF